MKRALITGATSGIGRQIAAYLHELGWQLVLTGRNERILQDMAASYGRDTRYIALDLSQRGAAEKLHAFCEGMDVELLVNNAGYGIFGAFAETSLESELNLIDLNIRAVHILTKLFLRDFRRQGRGRILCVASSAGFMTGPMLSSYYASKNYVVRLHLAIREELRREHSPVTISVLCPGPVDTNFNNRADVRFSLKPADARYVARCAVDGTLRGRALIIPTLKMKLALLGAKFCPEMPLAAVTYHIQKRKER